MVIMMIVVVDGGNGYVNDGSDDGDGGDCDIDGDGRGVDLNTVVLVVLVD